MNIFARPLFALKVIKMREFLWMAVTADEYELPIAVADTSIELGQMLGVSDSTITTSIKKKLDGSRSGLRYLKVENIDND